MKVSPRAVVLLAGLGLLALVPPIAALLNQPFYVDLFRRVLIFAIAAVSLLDCSPPVSSALGVMLVPFVALATSHRMPERKDADRPAAQPVRGVCPCGHVMSMHCHADCSGPCAVPSCSCEGRPV